MSYPFGAYDYYKFGKGNPGVNPAYAGPARRLKNKKPKPKPTTTSSGDYADPYWDDMFSRANDYASKQIQTLLAEVGRQQDEARRAAELEWQREAAKGQAYAYGLQQMNLGPTVQGLFNNAANEQAGLAQGFSGEIRDTANADAAQQARMLSGTGQEGAVRNEGEAMGNVTYGTQGYFPGQSLATQGANFGAQAALQPGFALQFGQYAEAARRAKWADELKNWADERAKVIGGKPDLVKEWLGIQGDYEDRRTKQQNDAYTMAADERDYKLKVWTAKQNAALAAGKFNLDKANLELKQLLGADKMNANNYKLGKNGKGQIVVVDMDTGLPVGDPIGPEKPATGTTPAEKNAKLTAARDKELGKITGVPPEAKAFLGTAAFLPPNDKNRRAIRTRAQLVRYLVRMYKARLARYNVKDSVIVELVNKQVGSMPPEWFKGWVAPPEDGGDPAAPSGTGDSVQ